MKEEIFKPFRLVGGTSLSLQLGHRVSVDIDLFTDSDYKTIDFDVIDQFFRDRYLYVETNAGLPVAFGQSWVIGESEQNAVKVDIYYADAFIRPFLEKESIRLASKEDIIAMKLEVIGHGGRKKDYWDLHALHNEYSIQEMISLHKERYPYSYTSNELQSAIINFSQAEDDLNPICLQGKHWELIKLDFIEWLGAIHLH